MPTSRLDLEPPVYYKRPSQINIFENQSSNTTVFLNEDNVTQLYSAHYSEFYEGGMKIQFYWGTSDIRRKLSEISQISARSSIRYSDFVDPFMTSLTKRKSKNMEHTFIAPNGKLYIWVGDVLVDYQSRRTVACFKKAQDQIPNSEMVFRGSLTVADSVSKLLNLIVATLLAIRLVEPHKL
ncbi:hypothetical protein HDV06_002742 [Boothiomyces sp. JEL0866]|nr:hypothetical protein HDV06_002742 [Boothiomyces sp. JEL0866]